MRLRWTSLPSFPHQTGVAHLRSSLGTRRTAMAPASTKYFSDMSSMPFVVRITLAPEARICTGGHAKCKLLGADQQHRAQLTEFSCCKGEQCASADTVMESCLMQGQREHRSIHDTGVRADQPTFCIRSLVMSVSRSRICSSFDGSDTST